MQDAYSKALLVLVSNTRLTNFQTRVTAEQGDAWASGVLVQVCMCEGERYCCLHSRCLQTATQLFLWVCFGSPHRAPGGGPTTGEQPRHAVVVLLAACMCVQATIHVIHIWVTVFGVFSHLHSLLGDMQHKVPQMFLYCALQNHPSLA